MSIITSLPGISPREIIETFARAAERTDFKAYEAEKVEFTRSK